MNQRKDQEYDKLERMIRYAQTGDCRRSYILGYFGDGASTATRCGHCDNCGTTSTESTLATEARSIDTPAGRETILKILSGVARTKGRFGKTVVAQMLTGSGAEKIARLGLTRLSTFGILSGSFTQAEVLQLIDALAAVGLIENQEVDRFRPVVRLTERGWEYLRNDQADSVALALPDYLSSKVINGGLERIERTSTTRGDRSDLDDTIPTESVDQESAPGSPPDDLADDPLWDTLRTLRLDLAREAKQPPYCIFTNETLEALVRQRPASPPELAGIKGLGPARLERFGGAILGAIANDPSPLKDQELSPPPSREREPAPRATPETPSQPRPSISTATVAPHAYVPTEEWTCRLLDRGFLIDEAAAIRGLERSAIVRHVSLALRQGRHVPLPSLASAETLSRWEDWCREQGNASPPDDPLAADGLWSLYLACRKSSRGAPQG